MYIKSLRSFTQKTICRPIFLIFAISIAVASVKAIDLTQEGAAIQFHKILGELSKKIPKADMQTYNEELFWFIDNFPKIEVLPIVSPHEFELQVERSFPRGQLGNLSVVLSETKSNNSEREFKWKMYTKTKLVFEATIGYYRFKKMHPLEFAYLDAKAINLDSADLFLGIKLGYALSIVTGEIEGVRLNFPQSFNFAVYKQNEKVSSFRDDELRAVYNLDFINKTVVIKNAISEKIPHLETNYSTDEYLSRRKKIKVQVGIIDTGIDYNHPSLAYKLSYRNQSNLVERKKLQFEMKAAKDVADHNRFEFNPKGRVANIFDDLAGLIGESPSTIRSRAAKIQFDNLQNMMKLNEDGIDMDSTIGYDGSAADGLGNPKDGAINGNTLEIEGHGTHVAGIASANEVIGLVPISFALIRFDKAVDFAAQRGVRVINISLTSKWEFTFSALHLAATKHPEVLFVVAAGNDSNELKSPCSTYPVCNEEQSNQINVAAVDEHGKLADFSNYGKTKVHIAALGKNVTSTYYGGVDRFQMSGTSMAAPQVTRVAALMIARNPMLTPSQIIEILRITSTKTAELKNKTIFGGYLNETAAIELAEQYDINSKH